MVATSREGQIKDLPIRARIIRQQAQQTIGSLLDAIVELVTNSDDSYRRLEADGRAVSGKIEISVRRKKGNEWEYLEVCDEGAGMNLDHLEATVIPYGEAASGFEAGRSVRGLFGRGLKEAIVALGEGWIRSAMDGKENEVRLFWDDLQQQPRYEITKESRPTRDNNGTRVFIRRGNCDLPCPTFEKLYELVSKHYALRDINLNKHRQVWLAVENVGGGRGRGGATGKRNNRVRYEPPAGQEVCHETIAVGVLGKATLSLWEAEKPLAFSRYDPCSEGGLVIKTEGAALDLGLFGYDNYESARYFFGTVFCPGIARKLREGDLGLVDSARAGLQWKHPACIQLSEEVRKVLKPFIEKKQKALVADTKAQVPEDVQKRFRNLCAILNRLAKNWLNPPREGGQDEDEPTEIHDLTIKPERANANAKEPRTFSIYLPKSLAERNSTRVYLELTEVIGRVRLLNTVVSLEVSAKHPELLRGKFQLVGEEEGDGALVYARYGLLEDMAEFRVQPPGKKPKAEKLVGRKEACSRI